MTCFTMHVRLAEQTILIVSSAAAALNLQSLQTVVVAQTIVQAQQRKGDPEHTGVALLR